MKNFAMALAAAALAASPMVVVPTAASAQDYGRSDPCTAAKHKSAKTGTIAGGVIGALAGSAVAGKGDRGKGAVIGGALGAVAGHQIGVHKYDCAAYPRRVHARAGCHWVVEDGRSFEICRSKDGIWRRSVRA